jgi:hypothetical protein
MIEIISVIVSLSTAIYSFVNNNKLSNEDKRNKIANFLTSISETLELVADKLAIDEIPHGACDAIKQYASAFPEIVSGYIDDDKACEYANMLLVANNVEMLIIETRTDKKSIEILRLAAWRFNVAAELLKLQTKN